MTQQPGPTLEYQQPTEPPANCSFCGRPIRQTFYRIQDRPACPECTAQIAPVAELNRFSFGPWLVGAVFGLAAAVLSGFAWAVIAKITHAEIGIVAIGVAYVVTRAIIIGAKGRRGTSIQILALILSLIGIFVGKGMTAAWVMWDQIPKEDLYADHPMLMRVIVFLLAPVITFQAFDLVWYGIAGYQAWRMAKGIQLRIQGPFGAGAMQPGAMGSEFYQPPFVDGSVAAPTQSSASSPSPTTSSPFSQAPIYPSPGMRTSSTPQMQQPQPAQQAPSAPRSTPLPQAILITLVTAAISTAVYAGERGWKFAAGSVLCILVHELGHSIACWMYGLPASTPIFIPYVGALISLRAQPPDAKVEAIIGIAGPVGGLIAAAVCYGWWRATGSELAAALTVFGAVINLFNLVPIHPLDGGRIARGVATGFWMIFTLPVAAFCALAPKIGIRTELAILLTVIAVVGVARTLMGRRGPYYDIPPTAAWAMGFAYAGVAGLLLWFWTQLHGVSSIF